VPYDLVVIGSGPGGYSAAVRAGQYGLKTALIEKQPRLGGTCLLVGCIPTKSLLQTAETWNHILHAEADGISVQNPALNFPKVMEHKEAIVTKHSKGVDFLMKKNKVDVIRGTAVLKGGGKIEFTSEKGSQVIETKDIIIATGSEARMLPGVTAGDPILTNIEILKLQTVPKTLNIIGAGAVGVEFASMFNRFGSKVQVFEMLPRIVPVEDEEISKELARVFKKDGIRTETGAKCDNIRKTAEGVAMTVTLANGKVEETESEKLLVAVGRAPNSAGLGLENTKVKVDRGFILTDAYQQTAEPHVYAIGDVCAGMPQLAHVATAQGMVAVAAIAGRNPIPIQRNRIPAATYTEPGIGSVGLTEAQARAQGLKIKVGKFPFLANSKATIVGVHDGFVKVIEDEKHGEILGVHIIGPQGYELIAEAVTAMQAEATGETMMHTIHAHPTLYEAVGEAFNAVEGLQINA
jgi:dihydrolipoamide dehydrogenase